MHLKVVHFFLLFCFRWKHRADFSVTFVCMWCIHSMIVAKKPEAFAWCYLLNAFCIYFRLFKVGIFCSKPYYCFLVPSLAYKKAALWYWLKTKLPSLWHFRPPIRSVLCQCLGIIFKHLGQSDELFKSVMPIRWLMLWHVYIYSCTSFYC